MLAWIVGGSVMLGVGLTCWFGSGFVQHVALGALAVMLFAVCYAGLVDCLSPTKPEVK